VVDFAEKPDHPQSMPGEPSRCLASMGVYVFRTEFLFEHLCRDANRPHSDRDFGKDIIPSIINDHLVRAWTFCDPRTGKPAYWRDVGTLESYYEANMDLISVDPQLNLYDSEWPIRSFQPPLPPPKFVFNDVSPGQSRVGHAVDSTVCPGSIISGGTVERSILGPSVRVNSYAEVRDSILAEGVTIGRYARVRRAIIDKNVHVPEGMRIGYDAVEDRRHGLTVTDSGIVAVPKNARFDQQSNVMKPHIGQLEARTNSLRASVATE
jgi:glucose-1-phosphate adenylyltransferase